MMRLKPGLHKQVETRVVFFLVAAVTCFFMIYTFHRRPVDGIPTKATWGWKT